MLYHYCSITQRYVTSISETKCWSCSIDRRRKGGWNRCWRSWIRNRSSCKSQALARLVKRIIRWRRQYCNQKYKKKLQFVLRRGGRRKSLLTIATRWNGACVGSWLGTFMKNFCYSQVVFIVWFFCLFFALIIWVIKFLLNRLVNNRVSSQRCRIKRELKRMELEEKCSQLMVKVVNKTLDHNFFRVIRSRDL